MAGVALLLLPLLLDLPPRIAAQEAEQCDAARDARLTLSPPAAAGQVRPHCKSLTLIRHAQGTHNAAEQTTDLQPPDKVLLEEHSGRKYWDAALTAEGEAQALALRGKLAAAAPRLEVVVTSSLRRALQTASIVFGEGPNLPPLSLQLPDTPFVATELCRERVAEFTCDGRGEKSSLQKDFPTVDFSEVTHESDTMWANKEIADGELKCRERAVRFAEWLMNRPERHIAVVSHGHFLRHFMTELQPKSEESQILRLKNAEMQEMELCPSDRGGASVTSEQQTQLETDAEYEAEEAARQAADRAILEADEEIRRELEALEQEAKEETERAYQAYLEQSASRMDEHQRLVDAIQEAQDAEKEVHNKLIDKQLDREDHLKMLEDELADLREQLDFAREDRDEKRQVALESHLRELQEKLDSGNY